MLRELQTALEGRLETLMLWKGWGGASRYSGKYSYISISQLKEFFSKNELVSFCVMWGHIFEF